MNIPNTQRKASLLTLVAALTAAVSCHVHAPDEAQYQAQVAERDILYPLLSDHDHLEEHHGQCLVKVMQPQGMAALDVAMDALETTDPLIIAAKYPFILPGSIYFTPLMYAISLEALPAVRNMLAAYGDLGEDYKIDKIKFSIPSDIQNTRPPNAGYTALLMALIFQNVDVAQLLVANGAPVNMHFDQAVGELGGSTPMHVGVATQNALVVEAMLVGALQPVDLEVQDSKNGSTPLDLSLSRNYINVAKCLLEHGANPNSVDRTLGWRPLVRPILKQDLAMVKLLMSHGANPYLPNYDVEGTPCLYRALVQPCTARLDLVRLLFDYVVDKCMTDAYGAEIETDINFRFKDGTTPLHVAVLQDDIELIRLILDLGSDVDPEDILGNRPLHMAIVANSQPIVELLVRYGADINARALNGKSPLERAAELNQVGIIKFLVDQGGYKYVTDPRYTDEYLPLLDAPSRDELGAYLDHLRDPGRLRRFEVVKDQLDQLRRDNYGTPALLDRLATDYVSALDNDVKSGKETMLHWAVIRRETSLFPPLINMGANINNVKTSSQGYTLLHHVFMEQQNLVLQDLVLLEELFLSYPEVNVNQRMGYGRFTPLHLTVIQGFGLTERLYDKLLHILRRLLAFRKTNVNAKSRDGNTALHFAIMSDRPAMAREILEHSMLELREHSLLKLNVKNKKGDVPLHVAVSAAKQDLVHTLLAHPKIDLNVEDSYGNTPLHRAIEIRSLNLVQQLLRKSQTNVNAQDKLGNTPLHLAASANMASITRALLERHDIRPDIQNLEGDAPIHSVVWCDALTVLAILASDERVNLNLRDSEGHTPLHLAICYSNGKQEAIETLLRAPRLDLSTGDPDGGTFLDLARQYNCGEVIAPMLLERMGVN
ncbi:MAG: ankyrin repeat domain-containing protein [Bacteroidota bacterium]